MILAALAGIAAAAAIADLADGSARSRPRAPRHPTIGVLRLLALLGRRTGAPAAPRDAQDRLYAAGSTSTPADLMAVKAGGAVAAVLVMVPIAPGLPGRLGLYALVAAPILAFIAPDLILRRRSTRRGVRVECELPDVLDLLRVALCAGLSTTRALEEVGARHHGLLGHELHRCAREIALGRARHEAYQRLATRCHSAAVLPLVDALRQAERHGAPPSHTFAALALEARAEHARRAADRAARAAPQIQLVVALGLVPSVLLLVGAALIPALG